jgi:two-component system sensor histidine kinase YesM
MLSVEAYGDLDTRLAVESEDEVGQLAHSFNTMLDEIRRLVDDVLRAQIHEREAELKALQNQINPHFLYNTLESINMLALSHGDRDISRMVTSLGRLLRLSISSSDVLIALRDELDYVNNYLTVQRMRYGERITMIVDIDDSLLDHTLPKLALQPVVENALYHGLEPHRGPGCVTIRGRRLDQDILELAVEDNGVGMDALTLAEVQRSLQTDVQRGGRSIGLANVHERLKLYCGPEYGLSVTSEPGKGTLVSFRIPPVLRMREDHGAATIAAESKDDGNVSRTHSR